MQPGSDRPDEDDADGGQSHVVSTVGRNKEESITLSLHSVDCICTNVDCHNAQESGWPDR